jgi:hypothetical protein
MDATIAITAAGVIVNALMAFLIASSRIGEYKNKVDTLRRETDTLKNKLDELSTELTRCSTKIDERTRSYASTLTETKSPISLSEAGKTLLRDSKADKFIEQYRADLIEKIQQKNPKSAYDVQTYARDAIESMQNEDNFKSLKDFAFQQGIDLEPLFIVMGIHLRDIALPIFHYNAEELENGGTT